MSRRKETRPSLKRSGKIDTLLPGDNFPSGLLVSISLHAFFFFDVKAEPKELRACTVSVFVENKAELWNKGLFTHTAERFKHSADFALSAC